MRSLTELVEETLVCERAQGIQAILFQAGFASLEEESVDSPEQATVFIRKAQSCSYNLEVVVKLKAAWEDDNLRPTEEDAERWQSVCRCLHIHGHWETVGPPDQRSRIPFVINVRQTAYQLLRSVQPTSGDTGNTNNLCNNTGKPLYRASGWAEVEITRIVGTL
jgi:hypothetical protein